MFRLLFLTLLARGQKVADDVQPDAVKHQEAEQKVIDRQDAQLLSQVCGYEFFEWSDCMYAYQMDWIEGNPLPGKKAVPMKRRALKFSNSKDFPQCRCTGTCNCPNDPTNKCKVLGYEWSRNQDTFFDFDYVSQMACSAPELAALENPASEKCAYTFASEPKKKCQDDDKLKDSELCKNLIKAGEADPKWLTCINFNINGSTSYKQAFPITEVKRGKATGDCVGDVDTSFAYDTTQCKEMQYTGKCWQKDSEILEPVMNGTPRKKSFDDADCTPPLMSVADEENCVYTYSKQPYKNAECVSFVSRGNFLEAAGKTISGFTSDSKDAQKNEMPTDSSFYKVYSITAVKRKDPLQRGSCDALNRANWTLGGSLQKNDKPQDCTYAKTQQSHEAMKELMKGDVPAQADVQSLNDDQQTGPQPTGPQLTPTTAA